jgi:hypothetical protein
VPNRILREGILHSPRMAQLGWPEEVFYRRLHSIVDDYGRYYADHGLLRAACYPRQLNKVSDPDIGKWLRSCADAGLVRVYPAEDGESYLEVLDFGQQVRAKKSKFPDPLRECAADAKQAPSVQQASAPVFVSEAVSEAVSVGEARKRARSAPSAWLPPVWMPVAEWSAFEQHRKAMRGVPFTDAARSGVVRDLEKLRVAGYDPAELLATAVTRGWRTVFEPRVNGASNGSTPTFRERDEQRAAERFHAMTGGVLRTPAKQSTTEIVDDVPRIA